MFSTSEKPITLLSSQLKSAQKECIDHPLFKAIHSLNDVQKFMSTHVYAVWDFMCLAKTLQVRLTGMDIPWLPSANPQISRLINQIILAEESDLLDDGTVISHYELYLQAMQDCDLQTGHIEQNIQHIAQSKTPLASLKQMIPQKHIVDFVQNTLEVCQLPTPIVAAVFTFSREDMIPEMFLNIINQLPKAEQNKLKLLKIYLQRHIELDGDEHKHLAMEMIEELCQDDQQLWDGLKAPCLESLKRRTQLWDGVLASL